MDIRSRKRAIRRRVIARVRALDPARRAEEDRALAGSFAALPGFREARCVLLYASAFPEEVPTGPLLLEALARGKRLVCPRVDRDARRLSLFQVDDPGRDLVPGALGIPEPGECCRRVEPEEIDWVLVPGVAFNARCYRLGRGAGYYDRLLPTLRPDAPRWVLIYDAQWVDELPVEPHDVPVDGVVSASRREFRRDEKDFLTGWTGFTG
jgi:5-formyltetrahydrofolate cyclo-ligase